jgi:hypothetical protein
LEEILGGPGSGGLEDDLLERIIAVFSARGKAAPELRVALPLLSAARDIEEARTLLDNKHLKIPQAHQKLLLAPALWPQAGATGIPTMIPFLRFLLLRRLAARTRPAGTASTVEVADLRPGELVWADIFELLRRQAETSHDSIGRLHHDLALGQGAQVADELAEQLIRGDVTEADWLRRLDVIVATPNLCQSAGRQLVELQPDAAVSQPLTAAVLRLIVACQLESNRSMSGPAALNDLYWTISDGYHMVAKESLVGRPLMRKRAEYYADLARLVA